MMIKTDRQRDNDYHSNDIIMIIKTDRQTDRQTDNDYHKNDIIMISK